MACLKSGYLLLVSMAAGGCLWGLSLGNQHSAVVVVVGGSIWSIPQTLNFYTNWSSSRFFHIGDTLLFDFESDLHNVMQVSRREYESCSARHPFRAITDGPAVVHLREKGVFYFICSVQNYCSLGQKLAVTVIPHSLSPPIPPPLSPAFSLPPTLPPPEASQLAGVKESGAAVTRLRSSGGCGHGNGGLLVRGYVLCLISLVAFG